MSIITTHKTYTQGIVKAHTLLSEVTEDTTSDSVWVAGAKGIMIVFTEGGTVLNRSGVLTVNLSNDDDNFYACNLLVDNVANAIAEGITRVGSKTRAVAGTDVLFIESKFLGAVTRLNVKLDVTDAATPTGNYTVKVSVCW